jgi:hypothetical protein
VTEHHAQVTAQAIERLELRRSDAQATLELLQGYRQQVETESSALENPKAVNEYLDFFADLIGRAARECERLAGELSRGISSAQVDALRQLASNSAAEQRRCLMFRDKCINRPLPDERMRPLLNDISVTTRDQLTAFRDLSTVAGQIEELLAPANPPPPDDKRAFDRRALFTRLFKP